MLQPKVLGRESLWFCSPKLLTPFYLDCVYAQEIHEGIRIAVILLAREKGLGEIKGPERLLVLMKKRFAGLVVVNSDSELTQRDLMHFTHTALVCSNSEERGQPSTGEPHPDLKG